MFKKLLITLGCVSFCFLINCQKSHALFLDPGNTLMPGGNIYTKATIPYAVAKEPHNDNGKGIVNVNLKSKKLNLKGLKRGESSTINVLGIVEMGDGGIYNAAKNAGIKKIHYVDVVKEHLYAYYFHYTKLTTIVYGE